MSRYRESFWDREWYHKLLRFSGVLFAVSVLGMISCIWIPDYVIATKVGGTFGGLLGFSLCCGFAGIIGHIENE